MTSNADSQHSLSSAARVAASPSRDKSHPPASPLPKSAASPRNPKPSSSPSSKPRRVSNSRLPNGHNDSEDAQNESEAETVVLGKDEDKENPIKTERNDDDDAQKLSSIREVSQPRSSTANGRKASSSDGHSVKVNGAKNGSERDAKSRSPVPTSPSSRTTEHNAKENSPARSAKSPVRSTTSPSHNTTRGRSSSAVDSRKRKLRDDSNPKIEPPRQKAKTEGPVKDLRNNNPTSPGTSGLARAHKRSQSTQSVLQGTQGRKRRELTAIALPDRKNWSDSGSETSSSPRPAHTPSFAAQRVKRSAHRDLISPARIMGHKKNTDKFGATRLAKECEKGDLSAVKAVYNSAPEELNQADFAGITPLQKASLHGWVKVVEYLIDRGCRTDCESNDRDTPLIDAVENGHLDVVRVLLNKAKVNPHHQNKKGQRAIDVVDPEEDEAERIEEELQAAMLRETNTTRKDDDVKLETIQSKPHSRLLYNEINTETLVEKAGDGDILAVGELINSNVKVNIASGTAASRGGHYDILSILLASGLKADPDPSKHSETPMLVAIGRGHLKIVQLLLDQENFDPTRRNRDGKAYYEVSEDRRGPKWEQERQMLKDAFDNHRLKHKSPKRSKKQAPTVTVQKRKPSPRRDRSSSPRPEARRAKDPSKASTVPQKPRGRLMSGREIASQRDAKRRRRVVDDESSSEESEVEVRRKKKVVNKQRSLSEGEDQRPTKKSIKVRSEKSLPAQSDDSDDNDTRKPTIKKIPSKSEKPLRHTPGNESPDDPRIKKMTKVQGIEGKIKRKRLSGDISNDDVRTKKTPTSSAKSTPAPPEKAQTPEAVRIERRQEAERQAAEAKRKEEEAEKRKKEEAEARRKEEEAAREAARKAAEEEEARKKAEAEAEAKRKQEEEEARLAAEAEAKRIEEELAAKAAARQDRISKLPKGLRWAAQTGLDRPLDFKGEELGISAVFLPLFWAPLKDINNCTATASADNSNDNDDTPYTLSFHAAGILGLPELDLQHLNPPFCTWPRLPTTRNQRAITLRKYEISLLAQAPNRFPYPDMKGYNEAQIQSEINETRQQFLDMEALYWIPVSELKSEMEKVEELKPLLPQLALNEGWRLNVRDSEVPPEQKKLRPKRSFADLFLANGNGGGINGEASNKTPIVSSGGL